MLKASIVFTLLLFASHSLKAQQTYHIENYTSQNGLPQNSVLSMEFDSDGYLWLSTEAGILKFDGSHFETFNTQNNPEIISDRGMQVLKTYRGTVIFQNFVSGPFAYKNGKLNQLRKKYEPGKNVYWIKGGMPSVDVHEEMVDEGTVDKLSLTWIYQHYFMFPQSDTSYIIANANHVYVFNGTSLVRTIETAAWKPIGYFMIGRSILMIDASYNLYRLHIENGMISPCQLAGKRWKYPVQKTYLNANLFHGSPPFKQVFVVSGRELYRISNTSDSNTLKSEFITDQLPDGCIIVSIAFDEASHSFAIGTNSKGLFLFREQSISTIKAPSSSDGSNNVYYAQLVVEGIKLLTSSGRVFDANTGKVLHSQYGAVDGYGLCKDSSGNIWYTMGNDIIRFLPEGQQSIKIDKKFAGAINVFYDYDRRLWVGSQNAIGFISGDTLIRLPPYEGEPIYCFLGIKKKGILTGFERGLFYLDPATLKRDTIHQLNGICVRALAKTKDLIFIGSYGNGFYLLRNDKLVKAPLDRHGNMQSVHSFYNDAQGNIWMTTNKGLYVTTLISLQQYFEDTTRTIYYYRFGLKDGIINDEFNGGCSPAYAKLPDGTVSFPTMDGLVWLKPEDAQIIFPGYSIQIDRITADKKDVSSSMSLSLHSDFRELQFYFSSAYYGINENIWIDYKIDGEQGDWLKMKSSDQSILIPNLPIGNYTLMIRKRTGFGNDDWVQVNFPFRVIPYFYQTWWFIVLIVLVMIIGLLLAIRYYFRSILLQNQRLENTIEKRTIELQLANHHLTKSEMILMESVRTKDKLISILSHDIITPLRFIGLSTKLARQQIGEDPATLAQTLGDIRNASGKLYDNATNILNWINLQNHRLHVHPSNVAVFSLVDELFDNFRELASKRESILINDISEDHILHTDAQLLGIVLSNIISNSIKFTRRGEIRISGKDLESVYKITITDTGIGISGEMLQLINSPHESRLLRNTSPENDFGGSGLGYLLIRDLLIILAGKYHVTSETGKGTTVVLHLKSLPRTTA